MGHGLKFLYPHNFVFNTSNNIMINQELARKWIVHMQRPEARKGVGRLTAIEQQIELDCCLGDFCKMMNAPREPHGIVHCFRYQDETREKGQIDYLPTKLAKQLNIRSMGQLTDFGIEKALEFTKIIQELKGEYSDLTDFNDKWAKEDKDFARMSALIEHLCDIELKEGKECFQAFID